MDAELVLLLNFNASLVAMMAIANAAIEINRVEEEALLARKRRYWMKAILRKRYSEGTFNLLIPQILSDDVQYRNFFRVSKDSFSFLLDIISPVLTKQDTHYRRAIRADEKLAITLRYLATGQCWVKSFTK